MRKEIKEKLEEEVREARETAWEGYKRIEAKYEFFDRLERLLAGEGVDFVPILEKFSVWTTSNGFQLYTYSTDSDAKEMINDMLIAFVELFGEGERVVSGSTKIVYKWSNAIGETELQIECQPSATGCKLVGKEVEVPAQPATTKMVYEVECIGSDDD
jgi:hypothetical protein